MTDNTAANAIHDLLRNAPAWFIDRPAYWLLGIMYEIFFNVSTAELFVNSTVKNFYSRVQLIIGVFMVFKLAITILQGIVNPDTFTDKKSGAGTIITRIIFSLVMLTLLVPINIPNAKNEYEIQLNNNGLLFGTLYSLQNRLLQNNTLGRLILGTTDDATSSDDDTLSAADKQNEKLKQSADVFSSTILKGFFRINLKPEEERDSDDETKNENRMCEDIDEDTLAIYKKLDADPGELLGLVNASCEMSDSSWFGEYLYNKVIGTYKRIKGEDRYVFAYMPVVGGIVALVFAVILLGFTVDIAIRAIKLAVLRLIAPIPIISYIQPSKSKDGGPFENYVRILTSTYLDLFIRLAIVYFVIFLIQDMIVNGIIINNGSGIIGMISMIFIFLGLFFFAKQAPKFIRDVLGLKNQLSNIGISAMLAGVGAIRQGGTLAEAGEAMVEDTRVRTDAYNQGKAAPPVMQSYNLGRDHMARLLTGNDRMTGRQMDWGTRHLNRMDINADNMATLKEKMYAEQDLAALAQNMAQRASQNGWGSLTNNEQVAIAELYRKKKGISETAQLTSDQVRELQSQGAAMYANEANTTFNKTKSAYDKMSKMQDRYGQSRLYEAEFEGFVDKDHPNRDFSHRAFRGLGRDARFSNAQRWRTQEGTSHYNDDNYDGRVPTTIVPNNPLPPNNSGDSNGGPGNGPGGLPPVGPPPGPGGPGGSP